MSNRHEVAARQAKARRLADVLVAAGADRRSVVSDPAVRNLAVAASGVHTPSDATWALVAHLVELAA